MKIDRGSAEGGRRGAAPCVTGRLKSLIGLWSSNKIKKEPGRSDMIKHSECDTREGSDGFCIHRHG